MTSVAVQALGITSVPPSSSSAHPSETLSYPSDLSPDEFELIKAFCPEEKSGRRPRTTDIWAVLNAIFYLVAEGCRWRSLPHDCDRSSRTLGAKVAGTFPDDEATAIAEQLGQEWRKSY